MLMIYSDAHLHSNPMHGLGAYKIAVKVKESGGWFMALVSLTPIHYNLPLNLEGFLKTVDIVIKECEAANKAGIKAVCLAGIHPAAIDKLLNVARVEKVRKIAVKVLKYIKRRIREGRLAGIGEVGRPHYPTHPISIVVSDLIMEEALEVVKETNSIAHLHLEAGGEATVLNIARKLMKIGLAGRHVIIHHADVETAKAAIKEGINVTVLSKLEILRGLRGLLSRALIESDFLDDPSRPCVATCPWDIPRNMQKALKEGILSDKETSKIFIDNIQSVYRVEY